MAAHDSLRPRLAVVLAVLATVAPSRFVQAGCNAVPETPISSEKFEGTKGFVDKPFALRTTTGHKRALAIGLRQCDFTGTAPSDYFPGTTKDYLVTVAFKPSSKSDATLVVLAADDCTGVPSTCGAGLRVECRVLEATRLWIDGSGTLRRLAFDFPSSVPLSGASAPDLAGPVAVAVTRRAAVSALPCDIATKPCSGLSGVVACVDELFTAPCGTTKRATFSQLTALPEPVVFRQNCYKESKPCDFPLPGDVLAVALDGDGSLLVPIEWEGISPTSTVTPSSKRGVRGWTQHPKYGQDVIIPGDEYVATVYSPDGRELIKNVKVGNRDRGIIAPADFVDSLSFTVLRIPRRACKRDGRKPCATDADCATSHCETLAGFDFSGELEDGAVRYDRLTDQLVCEGHSGSIYSSCKQGQNCSTQLSPSYCRGYAMEADAGSEGLKSWVKTPRVRVHVNDEREFGDHNDDHDAEDLTLELRDVESGVLLGFPQVVGAPVKKSARGRKGRRAAPEHSSFTLARGRVPGVPAVAAEDNVVAFLEATAAAPPGGTVSAGAGSLRVLERVATDGGGLFLEDRTGAAPPLADLAPLVDGQSLAVSGGRVFYRALVPGASLPELGIFDTARAYARVASAKDVPLALAAARAVETSGASSTTLGPVGMVAVAGGAAAFLRPTGSDPSALGDGEVWRWTASAGPQSLGRRATEVALSPTWIAARIAAPTAHGTTLAVHPVDGVGWTDVERTVAPGLQVAGSVVAFRARARDDFALQLYDAGTKHSSTIDVYPSAEDFVLSEPGAASCRPDSPHDPSPGHQFVAFRTREAARDRDLNGDGDRADTVLQVYDVTARRLVDLLGQPPSAVPCTVGACDPRVPYRIAGSQVRFLTRECEQGGSVTAGCPTGGTDLNGDGDAADLVVQVLDVCARRVTPIAEVAVEALGTSADPLTDEDGTLFFPSHAGRCVTSACVVASAGGAASDAGMASHRCILSTPSTCLTDASCGSGASCAPEVLTLAVAMGDDDRDGIPNGVDASPQLADVSSSAGPAKGGFFCKLFPRCSCCRGRR